MRRMMVDIPPKWKHLWDTWDLRGFIILSVVVQTFLIVFAPLRKRTSSNWIVIPLWSAYLLADWVASFSVGLITNSQENPVCISKKKGGGVIDMEEDLLAFWAPFLLVHLGGPDTITAFALEDNEFWLRHLISLLIQCLATIYVFLQTLPHNQLWIPTMLMFLNGTIKYAERTRAFYLASADRFKWSIISNINSMEYMEEVEKYFLREGVTKYRYLTELEVVQYAYCFFNIFKGLVVDLIFTRRTRDESRDFFRNRTAKDAFEVVEVELNFIYEFLFSKMSVVHGRFGALCRIFSFVTVSLSIVLFKFKSKSNFSTIDVVITYSLLVNALVFDIASLLRLIFSKKAALVLLKARVMKQESIWTQILSVFHRRRKKQISEMRINTTDEEETHSTDEEETHRGVSALTAEALASMGAHMASGWKRAHMPLTGFLKQRWSERVPTYNLIYYCLHPRSRSKQFVYDKLGFSGFADYNKYVKFKKFTVNLKNFIFEELKSKSQVVDDLEEALELSSSRGDTVLSVYGWSRILPYTLDADYGQRILLWHVATDLCYNKEVNDQLSSKKPINYKGNELREMAKLLSDYMMYLLIMKPSMIGIKNKEVRAYGTSTMRSRFSDVCAEATCILKSRKIHEISEVKKSARWFDDAQVDPEQLNACMKILAIPEEVWQRNVKGDLSNSLLQFSFILAKEVMAIEEEKSLNKWLVISKVWVELLCYGASQSEAKVQVAQVSTGGELITIVWLLMAHFGLGDQFQIIQEQDS